MQIKDLISWGRRSTEVASGRADEDHPLLGLQRELNRVFDNFWTRFDRPLGSFGPGVPRADVVETEDGIEVSVELPGMDEKDIRGEKKAEREENRKGYYLSERSYGSFFRSVPLPPGLAGDDAQADFKRGVLTVRLPKAPESIANVKRVDVKAA